MDNQLRRNRAKHTLDKLRDDWSSAGLIKRFEIKSAHMDNQFVKGVKLALKNSFDLDKVVYGILRYNSPAGHKMRSSRSYQNHVKIFSAIVGKRGNIINNLISNPKNGIHSIPEAIHALSFAYWYTKGRIMQSRESRVLNVLDMLNSKQHYASRPTIYEIDQPPAMDYRDNYYIPPYEIPVEPNYFPGYNVEELVPRNTYYAPPTWAMA
jgi:hypothetical protein